MVEILGQKGVVLQGVSDKERYQVKQLLIHKYNEKKFESLFMHHLPKDMTLDGIKLIQNQIQ